jgi:Rrf2 family protein
MDMTLSKRGDYVVRSAISLARAFEEGVPRKIREVVSEMAVPRTFASQILADLVRAGVASSKAGRNGGYWLARAPGDISVLEVVEAAEGPLHAERCALGEGPCRWEAVCPLHETWSTATAALREVLAATTLAEVAARDRSIEMGTYPIPGGSHRMGFAAVEVADAVHVELDETAARTRLSRSAHLLGPVVDAACSEVALLPVTSPAPDEQRRYLLSWKFSAQGSDFVLDADLKLAAVDAERCELRLEGTWRQVPAMSPVRLEASKLDQLARCTVRSFLRRLARMLESASEEPVGR